MTKRRDISSTNSYYEKVNGDEPVCIDDELPFKLPDGWSWTRLSVVYSVNPKNDASDDISASFVPMAAIEPDYANVIHPECRLWGSIKRGFTHFANGDIVFSKISPCFENGKYFLAQGLINGIGAGTTELFVLRSFGSIHLDRRFVFSYLGSKTFVSGATRTFMGTVGQQRVKRDYVEQSFVPIPPLEEQCRIANAVSAYVGSLQIG